MDDLNTVLSQTQLVCPARPVGNTFALHSLGIPNLHSLVRRAASEQVVIGMNSQS